MKDCSDCAGPANWNTTATKLASKRRRPFKGWCDKPRPSAGFVYAKKPFAGPETVLRYLSNYTHRVGMSSRRILHLDRISHQVVFRYRDYARGGRIRALQLDTGEFARRFALHILPQGSCKVRHYGLLANRGRERRLEKVRAAIAAARPRRGLRQAAVKTTAPTPAPMLRCPYCGSSRLRVLLVMRPPRRGQPGTDSS